MNHLIVLTHPSGVGKSTLVRLMGSELSVPVLTKDLFKETLFDLIPGAPSEVTSRFGPAAFELLRRSSEQILYASSLIVEANFERDWASGPWQEVVDRTGATPLVIELTAPLDTLIGRIEERALRGERHPGHTRRSASADAISISPIRLRGASLRLETNRSRQEVLNEAIAWIRDQMENGSGPASL